MNTFFCRAFQCYFAVGAHFLPWRRPKVYAGPGSLLRAADILRENGLRRPFVVASRRQCADEHFRALQETLDEQDILLSIFSAVETDPSVETVERIASQYRLDRCDCFLVIGGGSPMDAAKAAAARLARPEKTVPQLGGLYGVPHGLANAVLLPLVLEDYGAAAYPRLAHLARLLGLKGDTEEMRAKAFIAEIRAMNARMNVPDRFDCIRDEDIPLMARWAAQEANPVYPVPVIYDEARFARVIERARRGV